MSEKMTLAQCPIGLFLSSYGNLCLKTEYGDNEGRIDAYIVDSGEFFCGEPPQTIESQRAQIVEPFDFAAALRAAVEAERAACEAKCQTIARSWRNAFSDGGPSQIAANNQASGAEQCSDAIAARAKS